MDKIKEEIIRMIDGELSSEESSKVMEAINGSSELQAFYKAAQESTDSLQSYFNSEDISAANDRLKKSIKNLTQAKASQKDPGDQLPCTFVTRCGSARGSHE